MATLSGENKLTSLKHLKMLAERTNTEVKNLSDRIDTLVTKGGEPNVIEGVQVNGTDVNLNDKKANLVFATGSTNGTFKVNEESVKIAGLDKLAYKAEVSEEELKADLKAKIDALASSSDLSTLEQKVETLIDDDTDKSVRDIVALVVAEMLDEADDNFDTLKEIADWISSHKPEAAAMQSAIASNTSGLDNLIKLVGTIPTTATAKTVVEYVDEAVKKVDHSGYATKAEIEDLIKLTDITKTDAGDGNVVTGVEYNNVTGAFTINKNITALTNSDIASEQEVQAMINAAFTTA